MLTRPQYFIYFQLHYQQLSFERLERTAQTALKKISVQTSFKTLCRCVIWKVSGQRQFLTPDKVIKHFCGYTVEKSLFIYIKEAVTVVLVLQINNEQC